ncbi:UvrD-helicase domain-containing protein, partial [Staphylococcus aureus]|uniref:UvrD-helicase domain-containing protein n=1 Tax=Staphylococcus aureus TaxID=1280 RepID=UPI001C0FE783
MRILPFALDNLTRELDEQALWHAAQWIKQRFHQEKQQRAEMGFDDMLTRLDHALQGPSGERLAAVIRQQFPIALIDEFQDT